MTLKLLILTLLTSFLVKTSYAFILEALNNQNTTDECSDTFETCGLLDPTFYCFGDYYIWAIDNCAKSCNLCHVRASENNETSSTQGEGCKYHGQNFTQGENWIDACQYNCTCENGSVECEKIICPKYTYLPSGVHLVKQPGECCATPDPPIDTDYMCIHDNQSYKIGEWWIDGCNLRCECIGNGDYMCRLLCLHFDNMPSICHMDDVPHGLCCKQPRCPSGIVISIPKQYKDEYPGYTYV